MTDAPVLPEFAIGDEVIVNDQRFHVRAIAPNGTLTLHGDAQDERALLDAARRFVDADEKLKGDPHPDPGTVIASLAARHDMNLLAGAPCGCDAGTCQGLIGAGSQP